MDIFSMQGFYTESMSEPVQDALRAAEDAEDAAEGDAAMDEPGESVPWEQIKAELDLQADRSFDL
jgi:hypothetical protein